MKSLWLGIKCRQRPIAQFLIFSGCAFHKTGAINENALYLYVLLVCVFCVFYLVFYFVHYALILITCYFFPFFASFVVFFRTTVAANLELYYWIPKEQMLRWQRNKLTIRFISWQFCQLLFLFTIPKMSLKEVTSVDQSILFTQTSRRLSSLLSSLVYIIVATVSYIVACHFIIKWMFAILDVSRMPCFGLY